MFLNCHTYFSLRYGTMSPAQLVERGARWGVQTLALTDINSTSCAYEFVTRCREAGIKPVLGIDFRDSDHQCLYIGLARNEEGFRELNAFWSDYSLQEKPLPRRPPELPNCWIIYPRLEQPGVPIEQYRDHELLGIRPVHVSHLFRHRLLGFQHKLVILQPVSFFDQTEYRLHTYLRAIDRNTVLSKLTARDVAKKGDRLLPPETVRSYFEAYPAIIANTRRVLDSCSIELRSGLQNNRQTFTGSKSGDFALLQKLAQKGFTERYGARHRAARERLDKELRVIRNQDFCAYFLITWDIVRYAESVGYHHVGRGSGANSLVAYCIRLTDVDPLELDLYFERFINPYRTSPPDFDIDFSWDERDDVLDYIMKRYGRQHTALLATYSTFQGRAIMRELGKVVGLPKPEIDRMVAHPEAVDEHHELVKEIRRYGKMLEGFPNHLSIHAGGVLIGERPLHYHSALKLMPKGFPVVHFDMYHAEDMGFHKYDILSQRGLGHIKEAVELIRKNQGAFVDIHDVEGIKQDERVRAQLRSGQCMGCFYIESPAMRGLLSKLQCDNYVHLVAASSIIRPGVAKSGMMREYIKRFHEPEGFEYLHEVFREHLGETFGVMVYQEDVMKIVHHFAGLDLDESDVLRRIMSGKKHRRDTFEHLRRKYFDNCRARGYDDTLAQEVWRQVESFSGYSFCKAHSASFAVESFQSLYLKAYYPLEFMTAVINNDGGFYRKEFYVHEARRQGARVHAPCVNHSLQLATLRGTDLYLGLTSLHQLQTQVAHRIVQARALDGPFRNLDDFIQRVDLRSEQLDILIRIGAFRCTGKNKYELMWEKNALFRPKDRHERTLPLFETRDAPEDLHLPQLEEGPFDQAFDEIELLGFPLCSPFRLLDDPAGILVHDCIPAERLPRVVGRRVRLLGYYVCQKNVRTVKGQLMAFGTWIDKAGDYFDTVHFPPSLRRSPFRGPGLYKLDGRVVAEFGFPSVEVTGMERLGYTGDERF